DLSKTDMLAALNAAILEQVDELIVFAGLAGPQTATHHFKLALSFEPEPDPAASRIEIIQAKPKAELRQLGHMLGTPTLHPELGYKIKLACVERHAIKVALYDCSCRQRELGDFGQLIS